MAKQSWKTTARQILGRKAIYQPWGGGGPFALFTPCRQQVDFTLWSSLERAEKEKGRIGRVWCCGECQPWTHYIVDLGEAK